MFSLTDTAIRHMAGMADIITLTGTMAVDTTTVLPAIAESA